MGVDFKISRDERKLAIALAPMTDRSARIEVYDIENQNRVFKSHCYTDNLSSAVDFVDFSVDNNYLVYRDAVGDISMIDLATLKKISTNLVEFDLEWMSDGLQISEKTKSAVAYYNEDNKIMRLLKLGDRTLVVTDEIGTIRLFPYPCEGLNGRQGYYGCYAQHLSYISQCEVSDDGRFFITSSEIDRCIYIWRVVTHEGSQTPNQASIAQMGASGILASDMSPLRSSMIRP
eukprot:TRINITY_DN5539_c0_g2_i1.p1 TRINITY_DN5539_c0_g2~~TRINITY_DN5539_c0_g2_i1.p1  ORF type:complete len:232 (-),score=44.56 TRINITY_DN5539_c0_g2_i1:91-786(-)